VKAAKKQSQFKAKQGQFYGKAKVKRQKEKMRAIPEFLWWAI